MSPSLTFWTVGHSSIDVHKLFRLLGAKNVDVLVDVRSTPYSQFAPQANRDSLAGVAQRFGIEYVFLGAELGGKPSDPTLLLPDGKPDYVRMASAANYRRGIAALKLLAKEHHVCFMCSEEDPARCHRALLISETLVREGHEVLHIRHDGTIETHAEMKLRRDGGQLSLFEVA